MVPRDDDKTSERSERDDKRWWAEMMKDVTLTGLSAIFMTEDSVRSYLKDKNLPKELVSQFLEGLTRKKDDFYGLLAKEFGRVLSKMDLSREFAKFLEGHDMHFEAKVSFEPKGGTSIKVTESDTVPEEEKKSDEPA